MIWLNFWRFFYSIFVIAFNFPKLQQKMFSYIVINVVSSRVSWCGVHNFAEQAQAHNHSTSQLNHFDYIFVFIFAKKIFVKISAQTTDALCSLTKSDNSTVSKQ